MNDALAKKVRLEKYGRAGVLNAPEGYADTLGNGVSLSLAEAPFDCCLTFCFSLEAMTAAVRDAQTGAQIAPGGLLLLAYPKAKNKRYPAVGRDDFFPAFGLDPDGDGRVPETDFYFNLMVSLDATFTVVGLKNMAGQKARPERKSQSVGDYEALVPALAARLQSEPDALAFFAGLSPGYRRGWARYVYSPVKPETQEKRYAAMLEMLAKGVKSVDLA